MSGRRRRSSSVPRLGAFIDEVRNEEQVLLQRLKDAEMRSVLAYLGTEAKSAVPGPVCSTRPFDGSSEEVSVKNGNGSQNTGPASHAGVDFIYENSVGCIGLLAPWLERAFIRAIRTKSELVTLNILEATKPPFTILESDLHDGITGESIFNGCRFHAAANARKVHFLRRLRPDLDIVEDTASEVLPGANCSPKKRRFVGQQKPIRDNVGRPNDREKS